MNILSFLKLSSLSRLIIFTALFASLLTACAKRQDDPDTPADKKPAVEHNAEFPGGIDSFYVYLQHNIHYPTAARQNNVQGVVLITFVIDTDGSVTEVKVLRGIGNGCDAEALRVIKASPKWIPAAQNGRAVRQVFTVPISFTLTDSSNGQKQNSIVVGLIL